MYLCECNNFRSCVEHLAGTGTDPSTWTRLSVSAISIKGVWGWDDLRRSWGLLCFSSLKDRSLVPSITDTKLDIILPLWSASMASEAEVVMSWMEAVGDLTWPFLLMRLSHFGTSIDGSSSSSSKTSMASDLKWSVTITFICISLIIRCTYIGISLEKRRKAF